MKAALTIIHIVSTAVMDISLTRARRYINGDKYQMDRVKRIWYLSPMRAAKVQASLRIRAVSPEPPLLAHTSSESRGTFRQKARSLAPLNGWACAVKMCHDGMLEDTNSLDGAQIPFTSGTLLALLRISLFLPYQYTLTTLMIQIPGAGYMNVHRNEYLPQFKKLFGTR